jgi:hypothetical protein
VYLRLYLIDLHACPTFVLSAAVASACQPGNACAFYHKPWQGTREMSPVCLLRLIGPLMGAPLLDRALPAFLGEALFFDLGWWARGPPPFGDVQGALQHLLKAFDDLEAVAMLAARGL